MIKSLLFLAALVALAQAEPLTKPHPDCPPDGHFLLPHEYLCTKFYYCERGERFVEPRSCAAGTEFSFEMQVCIFPHLANCTLPGFPPSDAPPTVPPTAAPTTTTAAPTTTTAAPTTTTAAPTTTTAAPTTTTAAPTTTTAAPITQPPTQPPTQPSTQAPTSPPSQGTTDCERLENGCPVDFTIDEYFEHETSCRIFYRCVFGERVQQRCPRGTVFNVRIPGCDHPGSIDRVCFDEDSSEEDAPIIDDDRIVFLPNGCPADERVWFLPHERYCNVFYQCVNGQTLWSVCAAGTHFNPVSRSCDHIYNVNCRLPGGDFVVTTPAPTPVTPTTVRPILGPNGCPVDTNIPWHVPHEDCTLFYICDHGNLVVMQCPGGLHFNPTTQVCDNPATAGCANGPCAGNDKCTSTAAPPTLPPAPVTNATTPAPAPVTTPAPAPVTNATTPAPAPVTNATTPAPAPVTNATTPAPVTNATTPAPAPVTTPAPAPVTNGTTIAPPPFGPNGCPTNHSIHWLLPHEDCSKFYYCVYGDLVERDCPPGLHFNRIEQVCDFPEVAGCINDTNVINNTTVAPPTTQAPTVTTPPGNGTLNDPDENDDCTDTTIQDRKCEEECHVLPWAHEDCDKFWVCYNNKARLVTCSNGLYFNPTINSCDFACNVDCDSLRVRITPHYAGLQMYIPWHKLDNQAKQLLKMINEN